MTSKQIVAIIDKHEQTNGNSYKRYQRYYEGQNVTIQDKMPKAEPDNRKMLAYARIAVNRYVGYMFKPGNINFEYTDDENATIKELNSDDGQLKITHCATDTLTKGLGYIIGWQQDGITKWAVLPAENVVIEWSDEIDPVMLAAYYFFENAKIDEKGQEHIYKTFWKYAPDAIEKWTAIDNNDYIQDVKESGVNPAKLVNIAEFKINPEKRNLFYHVINLIDLMDETLSVNMANEIQAIANAILVLYGKYLDDEIPNPKTGETDRSAFLKAKVKILDGLQKESGEGVEWLVKNIPWDGIFGIFDRTRQAIYELLELPDQSDPNFQSAESGKALLYKTWAFENKASMIEANFKPGLISLVEILNAFPASDKVNVDDIKITFKRNFPTDRTERIKEAIDIMTILGKEVAAEYLGDDIIQNLDEVLARLREQLANELTDLLTGDVADEPQEQMQDNVEIAKDVVLNGAQIQSALKIIEAAANGLITRDTAVNQIEIFFNITRDKAEMIVGQLGKGTLDRQE